MVEGFIDVYFEICYYL